MGRRDQVPFPGFARRRPRGRRHGVRHDQPAGARCALRGADHRGLRGNDRRRELAGRRHGREHHPGEEADQRPLRHLRQLREADPPKKLSLEQSLEFCREDECVEVTPDAARIRKVHLAAHDRAKTAAKARKG